MTVPAPPPFKAEVVGSLLRPAAIHEARNGRAQGRVSADELWAIETRAIEDALALQRDAGLKVCTDGELADGAVRIIRVKDGLIDQDSCQN